MTIPFNRKAKVVVAKSDDNRPPSRGGKIADRDKLFVMLGVGLFVLGSLTIHSFVQVNERQVTLLNVLNKDVFNGCKWNTLKELADKLPGSFANDRLYLTGARFTTSYDSPTSLHVDLFGVPGDLIRNKRRKDLACYGKYSGLNDTLWNPDDIEKNVVLYCQLDCSRNGTTMPVIPMTMVPTKHLHHHLTTLVWRCNVTQFLDRRELVETIRQADFRANVRHSEFPPAWRVHFFLRQDRPKSLAKIASVDIPLDTGVAGHGGPQFRSNATKSYFLQPPVAAGLCVNTFGPNAVNYMTEFVQHHLNVGFGSIVIGMIQTNPDDPTVIQAREILKNYIDQGVVVLAYHSLPENWKCAINAQYLRFYQTCLFYHKGITKYSATWDLDEFWIPPKLLHMGGQHNHTYQIMETAVLQSQRGAIPKSNAISTSKWSTFPSIVQRDPLWQKSEYSQSVSIADTMQAIDQYYRNSRGCPNLWCFHSFPSRIVHLRNAEEKRTGFIGGDFNLIEPDVNRFLWQKTVVNTKYAHFVGFHLAGSCLFQDMNASLPVPSQMRLYHNLTDRAECWPLRFKGDVYGAMHHFVSLYGNREDMGLPLNRTWTVSSYVESFGSTVKQQMIRNGAFHQL